MKLFSTLLDLFFPRKCVFCGKILQKNEDDRCEICTESLPYTGFDEKLEGNYFDFCIAPLYYKDVVRNSMLKYKFQNAPIYADAFGRLLAETIVEHPGLWIDSKPVFDIITWVPLSEKRKKDRGYDQAELLVNATAKAMNAIQQSTFSTQKILIKTLDVKPQSDIINDADRRINIEGAYEVPDTGLIISKCILLIDDIITTGSTLEECSKTLLEAGASRIICATMCRRE